MSKLLFILIIFSSLVIAAHAQSGGSTFGPLVTAHFVNLDEELNELEYQIAHQEINRNDYARSKQRLQLQKQYVKKQVAISGVDIVPELQILTPNELVTMMGLKDDRAETLKIGDLLGGQWRLIGIENRAEKFFVLEKTEKIKTIASLPKPNPLSVIETIIVIEQDPEEKRLANINRTPPEATKPVVLHKSVELPRPTIRSMFLPSYSTKAREKRIEGQVIISALFTRDGKIKDLNFEQKLGYGLDENAMEMAKRIDFAPVMIDGQAVDIRANIVYIFSLTHTMATIKPLPQTNKNGEK
jgi:TonB family protein